MDLLRTMAGNRQATGMMVEQKGEAKQKVTDKGEIMPGTKAMRMYIIDKKPKHKTVKEHLEAIIARECETSSDEE